MFCQKCGNQIPEGSAFCSKCGTKVVEEPISKDVFCSKCGNKLSPGERFCNRCGTKAPMENTSQTQNQNPNLDLNSALNYNNQASSNNSTSKMPNYNLPPFLKWLMAPQKCLPSFVLGLIASIFGMFGGFCVSMCASFVGRGDEALIFIFGGSIIGLVGACMCLKQARAGVILEGCATLAIIGCVFGYTGGDFMTILSMLLFVAATIVGAVMCFVLDRK